MSSETRPGLSSEAEVISMIWASRWAWRAALFFVIGGVILPMAPVASILNGALGIRFVYLAIGNRRSAALARKMVRRERDPVFELREIASFSARARS